MTRDKILQLITEGLATTFDLDPSRITLEATLYEDLDIDSIDAVDLAAKLQRDTGTRMSPEVFKSVRTVGDLVAAVDDLLNSPADEGVSAPPATGDRVAGAN